MYADGKEALAGLQLLVAVAKADSALTTDERGVIARALEAANLPDGITVRTLIGSSSDIDALIAQIESESAREVAFAACLAMSNASCVCPPGQQAILDRMETAWHVPAQVKSLLGRVFVEKRDTVWLTPLESVADQDRREALVKEEILRHCVVSTVLGRSPLPLPPAAMEFARVLA